MKTRHIIISLAMCAMTVSSCLSVSDNSVNHTVYSLYDFTTRLVEKSLDIPAGILNGFTDEELFSPEFGTKEQTSNGLKLSITHPEDSVWCLQAGPEEVVQFTTMARMLPETVSFLGQTKHEWALSTKGSYTENQYSSVFGSQTDICYSWGIRHVTSYRSDEQYIISPIRKGSFRMDTKTGSSLLDYGILSMDGMTEYFESSLGTYNGGEDFYLE